MSWQAGSHASTWAVCILRFRLKLSRCVLGDGISQAQAHPKALPLPTFHPATALRNGWFADLAPAPAPHSRKSRVPAALPAPASAASLTPPSGLVLCGHVTALRRQSGFGGHTWRVCAPTGPFAPPPATPPLHQVCPSRSLATAQISAANNVEGRLHRGRRQCVLRIACQCMSDGCSRCINHPYAVKLGLCYRKLEVDASSFKFLLTSPVMDIINLVPRTVLLCILNNL